MLMAAQGLVDEAVFRFPRCSFAIRASVIARK
jgi:hypothetical protein